MSYFTQSQQTMMTEPVYYYAQQPIQVLPEPQIYYVNNFPHIAYSYQPDILYPVYLPEPYASRGPVSDLVNTAGDVVQNEMGSLENYVKNMEQQAYDYAKDQVKQSKGCCFGI